MRPLEPVMIIFVMQLWDYLIAASLEDHGRGRDQPAQRRLPFSSHASRRGLRAGVSPLRAVSKPAAAHG
jgi:hypothetical protein